MAEEVGGTETPSAAPTTEPGATVPSAPLPSAAERPVDLTTLPEFRAFQSKADAQKAESDRRAAEANAKMNALAAHLEAIQAERRQAVRAQLDSLDPVEQNAILKRRDAERDAQDRAKEAQARIYSQANAIVAESGLNPADPRLKAVWDMGATPAALDALTRIAPAILRQDAEAEKAALKAELEALKRAQPEKAKNETQRAVVAALNSAGVTATSSAPSAIAPVGAEEATMKVLREKWNRAKGKGLDNPVVTEIERELRKMGKTSSDLFTR